MYMYVRENVCIYFMSVKRFIGARILQPGSVIKIYFVKNYFLYVYIFIVQRICILQKM